MKSNPKTPKTIETIKRRSAYFIFWAWHLIYTVLVVALIIPHITWPLVQEVIKENVPWHYLIYAFLMALLPFVSMYLGAKHYRGNFRNLMKYFYGFEMALLFFLLVRMMTFRDSNTSITLLVVNVVIGLITWFIFLWLQNKQDSKTVVLKNNPLAIVGSTVLAMIGLYFGTMFLIIMIPFANNFIIGSSEMIRHTTPQDILQVFINPLIWLALIFVFFTLTLFIALPLVMIYLYIGQFIRRLPTLLTPLRAAIVLAVIGINVTAFIYLNKQPQQAIFSLLDEKIDQSESEAELLEQANRIKSGLLNAYLARYRYVSTEGLSQRIKSSYQYAFKLDENTAEIPQTLFNRLATPFLYEGKDWSDKEKAEKAYVRFFDVPIQKAERDTILHAVKYNWEMTQDNEAGLLDAANHYVHVKQQSIQIDENQGVASITIAQTLENLTYQQKETVLHFSLPEDAVLTGLWLSDNHDEPKKYPYVLAPKGAAQAVYKAEVQRRVDPALLEQTGPTQYRLRVYPIPRKEETGKPAKPMYMHFSYQTLADTAGKWPMPKVLEKRNLFWDQQTEHFVNGVKLEKGITEFFPEEMPTPSKESVIAPLAYQQNDQHIVVIPRQKSKERLPETGQFAILIDGSYSMTQYRDDVLKTIDKLRNNSGNSSANYTLYFCRQTCNPLDAETTLDKYHFFGNSQTVEQLAGFSKIKKAKAYDAVFVLTDEGSYELETKATMNHDNLTAPLWLVHMGKSLPYAYDDKVLDLIYQSKGGIAHSLTEALIRYEYLGKSYHSDCGKVARILSISNSRIWQQTDDPEHNCTTHHNLALEKIVTAQHIKRLINRMDIKQLDQLDAIHALAKTQGIVTHYSSMLVLVDDRQRKALKKAEKGADRFDREIETGKQNTTQPSDPFAVPAVPEPEEWALMIIAGVILTATIVRRRKLQIQRNALMSQ